MDMRMLVIFLQILVVSFEFAYGAVIDRNRAVLESRSNWNYDDPSSLWPVDFPMCGGEQQSPVNLDRLTVIEATYPKLMLANYDKVFVETLSNNGHTIVLQLPEILSSEEVPHLSGGGLPGIYNFDHLHFHWGSDSNRGSEHRISNQAFPAELHIVHYNQKYADFATASGFSDGIAVLAILIEVSTRDNIAFRHIQHFEHIIHPGGSPTSNVPLPIPLEDLIPDDPDAFFRYDGSLTTPECNESVIWTVYETPIAISERQLDKFRELFTSGNIPMVDNYRPIQQINNRIVTYRSSSF